MPCSSTRSYSARSCINSFLTALPAGFQKSSILLTAPHGTTAPPWLPSMTSAFYHADREGLAFFIPSFTFLPCKPVGLLACSPKIRPHPGPTPFVTLSNNCLLVSSP